MMFDLRGKRIDRIDKAKPLLKFSIGELHIAANYGDKIPFHLSLITTGYTSYQGWEMVKNHPEIAFAKTKEQAIRKLR